MESLLFTLQQKLSMLSNLFFLVKLIRVLKKNNVLLLIRRNIKYKIIFTIITNLLSIGVSYNKSVINNTDGQRIAHALNELGPSFIKLGQLISTRPDIVGSTIAEDLSLLRDNLPPFSTAKAIEIIEREFGEKIENIFSEFSEPIAAASIAQVHFAKIKISGNEINVAVKVLRPEIEKIIGLEMERLEWITMFMENFTELKRLRPNSIIKKAKEVIKFELDLRYEAAAASELSENTNMDESFYVPKIYWESVTQRVLTMERIVGTPADKIDELIEKKVDLKKASENLIVNFLRQSIRDGYFHADLHQGNLFLNPNGELLAVDFGIMGRLDKKNRSYLAEIIYGFIKQDYLHIAKIHQEAGLIDQKQSVEDFSQALRSIGEPIINQKAKNISMGNVLLQLFDITKQFNMSLQPQLLLLQKTMITVEGVARKLNPDINFWEISKPEIETWLKDELGIKNRLQQTQEALQSIARKVPDIPDFISRADQAFDLIVKHEDEKAPSNISYSRIAVGSITILLSLAIISVLI